MHFFFKTDANEKIGNGHLQRCLNLAEVLRNEHEITFVFCNTSNLILEEIKKKFKIIVFEGNKILLEKAKKIFKNKDHNYLILDDYSVNPPNVYGFGHQAYYEHVIDCISEAGPNLVDGFQGRKSIELISAIYESVETSKEVFLRFKPEKCKLGQK